MTCRWCGASLVDVRQRYCSKKCRQTAWRLRELGDVVSSGAGSPGRFAYADPPYPGLSKRYYQHEATYAGEVDHTALVSLLQERRYTGWALSTSSKALRQVLPLCPAGARVAAWVKPIGVPPATLGMHATWEPVIVVGGRKRRPGVRDWLAAQPARGGGTLMGRKPLAFCAWLFTLLGMQPGDQLDDLFPGTGIVSRAWSQLSPAARAEPVATSPRTSATSVSARGETRRVEQLDLFEVAS